MQMTDQTQWSHGEVLTEVQGQVGMITLNRAKALNALSLGMVRDITLALLAWQHDDRVQAVAMRGFSTPRHWRVIPAWKIFSPRNTASTT